MNRDAKWLAVIIVVYVNRNIIYGICWMVNKDTIYVPPESSLIPTTIGAVTRIFFN